MCCCDCLTCLVLFAFSFLCLNVIFMLQGSQSSLSEQLGIRINNVDCADYVTVWISTLENHKWTYDFKIHLVSWSAQFSFVFTNDLFKSHVFQPLSMKLRFVSRCFGEFFRPPKVILGRPNYVDAPKPFDDPGIQSQPSGTRNLHRKKHIFAGVFDVFHADCFFWCVGGGSLESGHRFDKCQCCWVL